VIHFIICYGVSSLVQHVCELNSSQIFLVHSLRSQLLSFAHSSVDCPLRLPKTNDPLVTIRLRNITLVTKSLIYST